MSRPDPANPPPPVTPTAARPAQHRVRKRFWLALVLAGLVALPFYPPAWHAVLRTWLGWQARRHGHEFSVVSIEGGVFDTTQLYGLRWRQRAPLPADGSAGTDLSIARADLTLAWTVPWFQRPAPSWVRELVLEGVRGQWNFGKLSRSPVPPAALAVPKVASQGLTPAAVSGDGAVRVLASVFPSLGRFSTRLVPEIFSLRADDLRLHRGRYRLHAAGLRLSGSRDDAGTFLARELTFAGPGFENTLQRPHAQTYWKGSRLTVSQLDLGPDVRLVSATLDGAHLDRRQIGWEGRLTALGGEVRGQGTVNVGRERIALEVAGSLQGAAIRPLVRLLGIDSPADGLIDQGNFSFQGDPENWQAAQMWLSAHSMDFRWGKRRWEDLALQAVIVNRRVQVHRLELRQRANRVSLTGECPLPPPAPVDARPAADADALRRWREGGFSCQVDARLDDLRSLAELFGPEAPEVAGRMSINGALNAQPGARQEINGYLNVEGTRLTLRGAPLDFLRSTLLFKGGGLRVADLQATHDADYFTGTGSLRLDGPPRHEGELRAEVKRLAAYTPALAGLPLADELTRVSGLTALLRWDDSLLRVEQLHGKLADAPFTIGGTVDLHDTEHPILDLSLDGENVAFRRGNSPEFLRADCALTIQGQLGNVPTLGGDVRLLGGEPGIRLELVSRAGPSTSNDAHDTDAPATPLLSLDEWLPVGWQGWSLDLDITAASPRGEAARKSEVAPDLHLTAGPGTPLEISGRIDLHDAPTQGVGAVAGVANGVLYFSGDADEEPDVAVVVTPRIAGSKVPESGQMDKIWFVGSGTRLRNTLLLGAEWENFRLVDKAEALATLPPAILTSNWVDDATPWAEWLAEGVPAPPAGEYELILR